MIIPASAGKGGGQSPSTVTISGEVTYEEGPAKVHDSQRYFSLTIGVEGKNKEVEPLDYSINWPGAFSSGTLDSPKSFFTIHCERDESYNVVTCSLGESYVLKAYGDFNLGTNSLTVTIDHIDYFEKVKREGLVLTPPDPLANFPIVFTVTFG
jgi:hypothetical protein